MEIFHFRKSHDVVKLLQIDYHEQTLAQAME
jgi:hypothetical protein